MESKKVKFQMRENKIGIAKKIVDALTLRNINILKMEINQPHISVEIEKVEGMTDFEKWIKEEVPEIIEIEDLDMIDFERRAKELQTIINSMEMGVIAVGKMGEILYFNSRAQDLFKIPEGQSNISYIFPKEIYHPRKTERDKKGLEFTKKIKNTELSLFIDVRLIKDDQEEKKGALFIIREMEEVRRLIQSISSPYMNSFDDIIGVSQSIEKTKLLAQSVSKSHSNIMILGESGTGKELFARAIHLGSDRAEGPFIAINCSAVPDSLIESEFFGYENGAFTGANATGKQGLFELATNGTLFLDEIGELPIHLQAKILRAIQEKKIRRVGGEKEISIDVRIISATHRNLKKMVQQETFREDLYYRLNVVPINIPPLRERKDDIPILAKYFVNALTINTQKYENVYITKPAMDHLIQYHWPGNVRELENVIERAIIFGRNEIDVEHLMLQPQLEKPEQMDIASNESYNFPLNLSEIIQDIEYRYIKKAKEEFKSSREIGKALGISHTTVIKKMKNYNLGS